jgi:archaellum biogenesis protein FlaJ (TadC family)
MRLIPFRTAAITLPVLFTAAIVFQLVVLTGFIPKEMVWGGRLQNEEERTVGALVSIAFLLSFTALVILRMRRPSSILGKWGMWGVCALFALNTVGNLFALDLRETLIFTPITLVSAVLAARLAMGE